MTPAALLSEVAATVKKLQESCGSARLGKVETARAAAALTKEIGWVFNFVQGIYDWKERQRLSFGAWQSSHPCGDSVMLHYRLIERKKIHVKVANDTE